ncbi:DUF3880 domain-containing protein [uncultured Pseudodesulfovibrio sp.]|uniref:CgeB family protein n=1 Tax=uncultured Pseudodesulfovibrio sp. TaxID=2035858 RepID=UPI0029C640E4|nr:DUF3880 domain-containing protein [uncultured Pseudodesulfovibrio sp.]
MKSATPYSAEAVTDSDGLSDIRIHINGKTWHLWGRNGLQREADLAAQVPDGTLPVLIGAGLGHCLSELAQHGPIAVIDRESAISEISGSRKTAERDNILWIDDANPQAAMDRLIRWQADNGGKPFAPVLLPLYLRLNRDYYGLLADTLKEQAKTDFWTQARYPKFESATPRILFFNSSYFLCDEILSSLQRLGIAHQTITLDQTGTGSQDFIEKLLKAVIDFKPDFILTVNHFGLDREGKLAGLLSDMGLPLASWFVDNPHLILHEYAHPGADNTAIFTFDAGNLGQMRDKGFQNVHYLPLATDPARFRPNLSDNRIPEWSCDVSFVGNSMTRPVATSLHDALLTPQMQKEYENIAAGFGASGETDVVEHLKDKRPDWRAFHDSLPTPEARLALESLITWEATRQYRFDCVARTLQFAPLIVGDSGWKNILGASRNWRHIPGLDYYKELPRFYPQSKINFNCTSRQMIGAVNQRVFDVPACGGFVLTDHRKQMEDLFDLSTEAAVYHHPDEIPSLIRQYLSDKALRDKVSRAARKRILAEHTYEIRISKLIKVMRSTFST